MPFDQLLNSIFTFDVWHFAKFFVVALFLLYIIFAYIVFRQTELMAKTLNVPIDLPIRVVAWVHLGLAIFAFLLAMIVL